MKLSDRPTGSSGTRVTVFSAGRGVPEAGAGSAGGGAGGGDRSGASETALLAPGTDAIAAPGENTTSTRTAPSSRGQLAPGATTSPDRPVEATLPRHRH